ncbi:hypothetical protein D3C75_832410 [compost metagenome]
MEKKDSQKAQKTNEEFLMLYNRAHNGDKEAMQILIKMFDKDIDQLVKFIPISKEDAKQELITELISIIKNC